MIKELLVEERPRERCLNAGPQALSLRECLAVLLGSGPKGKGSLGLAREILEHTGDFPGATNLEERAFFTALESESASRLDILKGLGQAGRSRLLVAFEIARRYASFRETSRLHLTTSVHREDIIQKTVSRIAPSWRNRASEWLGFVPIFKMGGIGELCLVEKGTRTHVNVDLQELFAKLLALRPQALVLVHNHPSGDLRPSAGDHELTSEVGEVARKLGMELVAHLIVASTGEFLME